MKQLFPLNESVQSEQVCSTAWYLPPSSGQTAAVHGFHVSSGGGGGSSAGHHLPKEKQLQSIISVHVHGEQGKVSVSVWVCVTNYANVHRDALKSSRLSSKRVGPWLRQPHRVLQALDGLTQAVYTGMAVYLHVAAHAPVWSHQNASWSAHSFPGRCESVTPRGLLRNDTQHFLIHKLFLRHCEVSKNAFIFRNNESEVKAHLWHWKWQKTNFTVVFLLL